MARRRKRATFRRRGGKPYGQAERERATFECRVSQLRQQHQEWTSGVRDALLGAANAMAQVIVDLTETVERVSAMMKSHSPQPVEVVIVGWSEADHEAGIGLKLDRLPGPGPIFLLPTAEEAKVRSAE